MKNTFYLVSLGCAKNTVDSDSMAALLVQDGYRQVSEPRQAALLVVNTCGFIAPAREESYQVLRELAAAKRKNQWLIAAGCLTQRYGAAVARDVPGVDAILGTRRWMDIVSIAKSRHARPVPAHNLSLPEAAHVQMDAGGVARVAVQGTSAYLKIADGCRRCCAFCAIPSIKGGLVSRPMELILRDAQRLQREGIQELILLAQDTTDYGYDLGLKDGLPPLLKAIAAAAPDIPWMRILYTFPGYVSDALIEVMATHTQIVPYLDLPLQHAHPAMLKRMQRPANVGGVMRTLEKVRRALPQVALRTTFIVGYPGETEEEFQTLLDFVETVCFDKLGAFQFSFEKGTPGECLGDDVPLELKQARWEQLMALQQRISLEKNQALVGKTLDVLVEGQGQGEVEGSKETILVGRSYRDAPEIDGLVFVEGMSEPPKTLLPVRITGAMAYDLVGAPPAP